MLLSTTMGGEADKEWESWNACLRSDLALPGALPETYVDEDDVALAEALRAQAVKELSDILSEIGKEEEDGNLQVYLGTASRILPETMEATDLIDISTLTRAQMREKVRRAFDDPVVVAGRGGRPRASQDGAGKVMKIVVVKERHASGEVHFHWAVKIFAKMRFALAKRTLSAGRAKSAGRDI